MPDPACRDRAVDAGDDQRSPAAPTVAFPDIAAIRYEDAREELVAIVSRLEAGQAPLEDSMQLWRRGEALAAHCSRWLDGAQAEIERATRPAAGRRAARRRRDLRRATTTPVQQRSRCCCDQ